MYNEKKELLELDKERLAFENEQKAYQYGLSEDLNNYGLGDDILNTLKNPPKISKFKLFKYRIKMLTQNILDVL